jgi:AAA family ATP:ADP antiporter
LSFLGLGLAGISLAAVPISMAWLLNGLWLGRRNEALARERREAERATPLTA